MSDDLQGTADVLDALRRLTRQGLGSTKRRGLTTEGVQTLGDLLAVATFQFGAADTPAQQTAAAAARATLAALADVIAEVRDEPASGADTQKLLAQAVRVARGG